MELSALEILYCGVVVLVLSYAVRGSTGFGSAAAMPLMGLVVPLKILVPLWTLMGIVSSAAILGRDRRHVSRSDILPLLPTCLIGVAIGLYVFKTLDVRTLTRGLGLLVIAYGLYSLAITLRAPGTWRLPPRMVGPAAGLLSGMVGTAFGTMASLFFAAYLDARKLDKTQYRATMSALILGLSIVRSIGYFAVGEFGREVWVGFALALPMMLLGVFLGDRIHAGLSDLAFRRVVSGALIASGIALLLK
jgi:uncharacterized protein